MMRTKTDVERRLAQVQRKLDEPTGVTDPDNHPTRDVLRAERATLRWSPAAADNEAGNGGEPR